MRAAILGSVVNHNWSLKSMLAFVLDKRFEVSFSSSSALTADIVKLFIVGWHPIGFGDPAASQFKASSATRNSFIFDGEATTFKPISA